MLNLQAVQSGNVLGDYGTLALRMGGVKHFLDVGLIKTLGRGTCKIGVSKNRCGPPKSSILMGFSINYKPSI